MWPRPGHGSETGPSVRYPTFTIPLVRYSVSLAAMKMLPVSFRGILIRLGVCQGAPPSVANFYSAPQCSHCKRCISYSNSVRPSVRLSVRLSVRPSVTRRYCVKTMASSTARSMVQFARSDSKTSSKWGSKCLDLSSFGRLRQ